MRKLWKILLFAAVLPWATSAQALTAPGPEELVKSTSEEVLGVIRDTDDRQKLLRLAEEKVLPHFDFPRMTQLAVGRFWRQATPEQRQRLQDEFRNLLVRTYTNALEAGVHEKHGNTRIRMKPSREPAQGPETVVRTEAIEPGRPPVAIDYYMAQHPEGWKVYDVTVDSVSLVTNYRSQFAGTVSQSGIDGLIDSLAQKNKSNQPTPK